MKYLSLLLVILCLSFAGCNSFALEDKWLPLTRLVDRPAMSSNDTLKTCIGDTVYIAELDKWLEKYPTNSRFFQQTMYHEQVHSKREFERGLWRYLAEYAVNPAFMWREEQLGYYVSLKYRQRNGMIIIPEYYADILAGYKNIFGSMVSKEDALLWVTDVLNNRWKPDKNTLWSLPDFVKQ